MIDDNDLELHLKVALRPVAPPPGMAGRIIARANRSRQMRVLRWGAIAAGLFVLISLSLLYPRWRQERHAKEIAAREATEKLQLALNVTSRKISRVQKQLVVEIHIGSNYNN